jgi:N-acetyl-anhydromuramyl-L-alanine amidase AmpD
LKVEVKSYFRILQPDGRMTPSGKKPENDRIGKSLFFGVLDAEAEIKGKNIKGNTAKGNKYTPAILDITCLEDGTYTLHVEPPASRKSKGPAGPDTKGKEAKTVNDLEARMYQPVDVSVRIAGRKAVEAKTVFRVNYANAWVKNSPSDTVFIDLKPDWWGGISGKKSARDKKIDLIVLHNTGANSDGDDKGTRKFAAALRTGLEKFCAPYYVDLDGHVVKLYDEAKWATWHAGDSTYGGESSNKYGVGIEICRPLEGFQLREGGSVKPLEGLRKAQFDSVARLTGDLQTAYKIPKYRITGHCDGHKAGCPGCDFWWERLEAIGQGMVLQEPPLTNEDPDYAKWFESHTHINAKASEEIIGLINKDLEDIGYKIKPKKPKKGYIKEWSQLTVKAVKWFQYHFHSGARYHLRFEYKGKPKKLKDTGVWEKNSLDGGRAGGKQGVAPPGTVDRDLARRIRAVADYVRNAKI